MIDETRHFADIFCLLLVVPIQVAGDHLEILCAQNQIMTGMQFRISGGNCGGAKKEDIYFLSRKQWAAVITVRLSIKVPPHRWPQPNIESAALTRIDTVHGTSFHWARLPPTILNSGARKLVADE